MWRTTTCGFLYRAVSTTKLSIVGRKYLIANAAGRVLMKSQHTPARADTGTRETLKTKTFGGHEFLAPRTEAKANPRRPMNAHARTGIHCLPAFAKHVHTRAPFSPHGNAVLLILSNNCDLPLAGIVLLNVHEYPCGRRITAPYSTKAHILHARSRCPNFHHFCLQCEGSRPVSHAIGSAMLAMKLTRGLEGTTFPPAEVPPDTLLSPNPRPGLHYYYQRGFVPLYSNAVGSTSRCTDRLANCTHHSLARSPSLCHRVPPCRSEEMSWSSTIWE